FDPSRPDRVSQLLRHYVGGLLEILPELTLLFAPNVNSYKRFVVESAAGTTVSWGFENRTCGLRVINESEEATRVENRVPGGDANPYLAMAGCIAGGLYGIEHGIEPPEPHSGNAYRDPSLRLVPLSLEDAIRHFEDSAVVNEYLGEEFVRFFAATRRWELEQFRANVTDWEIRRYLPFV
ncbi:MAG: type I glutamate--ammonia ligase, partial [Acidimicrobiales bacterium]